MKSFIFFLTLVIFSSAHALNYGNFKVVIGTNAPKEITFYLNSQGDVEQDKDDTSYKLVASDFLDMTTVTVKGTNDEQWTEAVFILQNNQVQATCASVVDKANKIIIPLRLSIVTLKMWDEEQNKFVQNYSQNVEEEKQSCFERYFERYSDYTEL